MQTYIIVVITPCTCDAVNAQNLVSGRMRRGSAEGLGVWRFEHEPQVHYCRGITTHKLVATRQSADFMG